MPAEAMLTRFLRGANGKFVPNAIPDQPVPTEDAQLCARQRFGWAETDYVAGATGRLSESRGIPEFIDAAKCTHAPLRWTIAGVGPMQHEIDACDPACIQTLDYASPSDDDIAAIDVYVQSPRGEGLSLSLLQAMRAAKAIVAARVNASEVAVRGVDGLLEEPRSARAMADGFERMHTDPGHARRLGASARARYLEKYWVERQAEAYEDLCSDVCARNGSAETSIS
jgi:glycosyltransferase involved in cell wall biosynthesis